MSITARIITSQQKKNTKSIQIDDITASIEKPLFFLRFGLNSDTQ